MRDTTVIINSQKLEYACQLMRALAHPLRLKILEYIDEHVCINVNRIYGALDLEQSITSQHLKVLKEAGVVSIKKDGKFVHYYINYDIVEKARFAVDKFIAADKLALNPPILIEEVA